MSIRLNLNVALEFGCQSLTETLGDQFSGPLYNESTIIPVCDQVSRIDCQCSSCGNRYILVCEISYDLLVHHIGDAPPSPICSERRSRKDPNGTSRVKGVFSKKWH